ncbi:MAG: hypothetical protein ABMB14_29440 [Myxococcota bacterium]
MYGVLWMAGAAGALPAFARDGDEAACDGLAIGDDCTRADGDAGACVEDDSDPGVVTCDDDGASSSSGDSSGCATVPGAGWLALGLGAAGAVRRRSVSR